ncbi:hypothetical protein AV649_19020 [Rossellomorea marisflavi]|uniref:Uncharacterized protein n=1 Tax=Rossellomorea marisflavi TaxID=189381 RepID=A0A163KZW0_9BACI|nr:hypothetical protein AV649_19020 [Rossellomorea marisflavi]
MQSGIKDPSTAEAVTSTGAMARPAGITAADGIQEVGTTVEIGDRVGIMVGDIPVQVLPPERSPVLPSGQLHHQDPTQSPCPLTHIPILTRIHTLIQCSRLSAGHLPAFFQFGKMGWGWF